MNTKSYVLVALVVLSVLVLTGCVGAGTTAIKADTMNEGVEAKQREYMKMAREMWGHLIR